MKDFKNVLRGDYSDPTTLRVGNDYYLIASTFKYCPPFAIWHSTDLQNWEFLCYPLEKYIGNVMAADLVLHEGRYFIYYQEGVTNWVMHADSITGPWSDPIDLKVKYIDPGHIVDDDGKRYLFLSCGNMIQLADDGLSTVGEMKHVYDGWEIPEDWEVECMGLEGPKLIKKGEYFYMVSAEGGTAGPATSHMVVAARAKSLEGPWENSPYNPIIHTYSDEEKWWSQGHGNLFDTPDGDWYIIYHGYEKGYHTLGRQSLISKIVWTDDEWFHAEEIENYDKFDEKNQEFLDLNDDFKGDKLAWQWNFFGSYDIDRCNFTGDGMEFSGKGESVAETTPMLIMQYSNSYEITVEVELTGGNPQAGLVYYYNENAYLNFGVSKDKVYYGSMVRDKGFAVEEEIKHIYLKLKDNKNMMTCYYSYDNENWTYVAPIRNVSGFNHNTFDGFLSLRPGLYCIGDGTAKFKNFTYKHLG